LLEHQEFQVVHSAAEQVFTVFTVFLPKWILTRVSDKLHGREGNWQSVMALDKPNIVLQDLKKDRIGSMHIFAFRTF
jgi:hypothetical protein